MTRTFLYIFTFVFCSSLIGQGVPRFLWTPVLRPFNYRPATGVNRYDPTKTGQSFTHSVRWGNYPNQFKPTQKSVKVGNTATTVRGRGYSAASARRNSKGIAGVAPRLELFGPPQKQMLDTREKFSDFILNYRTDILTSGTPHGFFTGDLVKFDSLPQLSPAAAAGNDRNPQFGANPLSRVDPGSNPANNPLPGLLNEDGYYEAWLGDTGTGTGQAGSLTSNSEANATLFAVRRLDDWRLTLHPTVETAQDIPREEIRIVGPNQIRYDYPGAKPSNFVVNQPVIGAPATGAPVQAQEFMRAPYTLSGWKDICVSSDSISETGITVRDADVDGARNLRDSLNWNAGNSHNLTDGQGVFFDDNPPQPLNTESTYFARTEQTSSANITVRDADTAAGSNPRDSLNWTPVGNNANLNPGEEVLFAGTPPPPLSTQTTYYAGYPFQTTSANITVRDADTPSGTGEPRDSLNWNAGNHNLNAGEGVFFTGTPPPPLNTQTTYYAGNSDVDSIQLYNTSANAVAAGATGRVDLTGPGGAFTLFDAASIQLYTTSANAVAAGATGRVDLTGPGGAFTLVANSIQLYATSAQARAGGAAGRVNLQATGMLGGAPSFTLYKTFQVRNDGPAGGPFHINRYNHGLKTGDIVYWNRTRWNDTNPTAGPGATTPTPDPPGVTGGGLFPSNEHFYVSVNDRQVWLHINDQNATINGDVGPGANPIRLIFDGAILNDCVGNNRFPIYAKRTDADWKWRTSSLSSTAITTDVSVDKWRTVGGTAHPDRQPTGAGNYFEMVTSASGVADPATDIITFGAGACPWRTGDIIVFEPFVLNPTFHAPTVANVPYYVFNVGEEANPPFFNQIMLYHINAPGPASIQDVYANAGGATRVDLTGNGPAHSMNSPIKCVSTSGVHLLETGDRVRVEESRDRTPNPDVFGNGPGSMREFVDELWVSVRSRNADNEPWVYFHSTWADAMNTRKPDPFVNNPPGTREAPGANPRQIWNATTKVGTVPFDGRVSPYKLQLENNNGRLRSGDAIIFPPLEHGAATQNNLPTEAIPQIPLSGAPVFPFDTIVFASVSKGNNNFDTSRVTWDTNPNILWTDMGGPGNGANNRGNNPDIWWLSFHLNKSDAIARDPVANPAFIGNGAAALGLNANGANVGAGNNGPHHFHRSDVADRINAGGVGTAGASPEWTQVTTGTAVTASAGGGVLPATLPAALYYIRKQGPGNKDLSFHTTQDDAINNVNAPVNPVVFTGEPGTTFTLTVGDRVQISDPGGNNPFQNGDRVRFTGNTPDALDSAAAVNGRPDDLFRQTPAPPNTPKYNYFYVSVNDANLSELTFHETYEDATATGGGMSGLGTFSIAHDSLNGPWSMEWIRPPRFTGRSRFQLSGNHNLSPNDFLYFAPHTNGKLPATWDANMDIDGDGVADGSWRGIAMNTPYRVMNTQLGSVDRPRGFPWTNPNAGNTGPSTGYDGWLSPTTPINGSRGDFLHIAYAPDEAQIVEGIDSSAAMRATWRDLGINPLEADPNFAAATVAFNERPENNFSAFRDNGYVRVRLRTDDSHSVLDVTPGNSPTDINLNRTVRRSLRSEFRLKFLRHNFYHAGPYFNNPSGDVNCFGYWANYRYFATYEARVLRNNRAGLEANSTFIVMGVPRAAAAADIRSIIPVSGLTLAALDGGVDNGGNPGSFYTAPHLRDPWTNPTLYQRNYGWDASVTQNGGYRWNYTATDNRWANEPICWKGQQANALIGPWVYSQGAVPALAERIRHPEDLDTDNLISVTRAGLTLGPPGNPPTGPLTGNVFGTAALTPFGADPDIPGDELPNMPFGANIDAHDVYLNDTTIAGTGVGNGAFPLWMGGKILAGKYSYPRWNLGANVPDNRNISGNGPRGRGTDSLGQRGNDLVGIREYDRRNGYSSTRLFGDFFVSPTVTTTVIDGGNTVSTAQGVNSVPNTMAIPGVPARNNLVSTRNLSEVMRLGDLGVKVRRMNRLPSMFGPEYVLTRMRWDAVRGEWVVELVGPNNRLVIAR